MNSTEKELDSGVLCSSAKKNSARWQKAVNSVPAWKETTESQWNDWQWQQKNRINTLDQLCDILKISKEESRRKYEKLLKVFHFSVTPYYFSLINFDNPVDPVLLQAFPDFRETSFSLSGYSGDPLEEHKDMPVAGLVHRYPDRCLAIVTNRCDTYCRHCTRKRLWQAGECEVPKSELQLMFDYVASVKTIREVIISGGDPLTLSIDKLDWILEQFGKIPHVEVLRIGSRVPVVMPMRITKKLCDMLKKHRPLWLNTQFNHFNEITPESAAACSMLLESGIPVSNQSVLLKDVNNSISIMKRLLHKLQTISVMPYYMFQCDLVTGTDHFRTDIWTGIDIIEKLRGHTSGLVIPQYVIDAPGGGGKIPLQPFYFLSSSDKEIVLRNYEGKIFKYPNNVLEISRDNLEY